ncbi:MAG TPA: prevent-host-death protein [Porphyromonadaceae bacterium]|nr:prevent-host-death protein [Porphyromonadaceae bacterium]
MIIISSKEFRNKQKSYLDKVDEGLEVLIRRGKGKSYKIVPMKEDDDSLMSKEEFFAKIDRSLQDIKEGRFTRISGKKELKDYLASL